jgi:diguanylate cyclase (GGDEF)-like protein
MPTKTQDLAAASLTLGPSETSLFRRAVGERKSSPPRLNLNGATGPIIPPLGWQACTCFFEFLLAASDPSDVVLRAAAGFGLLPQVSKVEIRDLAPALDEPFQAFLPHPPKTDSPNLGRWIVLQPAATLFSRTTGKIDTETSAMLTALLQISQQVHEQAVHRLALLGEALTDPLTGLLNRRGFLQQLDQALARRARRGETLTLLLIDIDYFKQVNDVHGHALGDAALTCVAQAMLDVVRPCDVVARLGGDELALLLSSCDAEGGLVVAQRLQGATDARNPLPDRRLTLSMGVAESSILAANDGADRARRMLFDAADEALYAAKRAGRACARAFGSEPDTLVDLSDFVFELPAESES